MTLAVRPVDLEAEQDALLEILQRNLPDLPHARRFKWAYQAHPLGPARAWFVCDRASGRVVGTTALFPRALWVGGSVRPCGQVGDFAVDESHRTLGPALMLQRATFDPVQRGALALCYDCPPHALGLATFRRLGLEPATEMLRFVRLLRVDRQLRKCLGERALLAPLAPILNAVLGLASGARGGARGLEIGVHRDRFGDEFSALDRRVSDDTGIRGRRAAEDLNWRYRDDPLVHDHQVLTARRHGELVGYAVFHVGGEDADVEDLFGALPATEGAALLDAVVSAVRRARVQTLQALVAPNSALVGSLDRARFHHRSSGPRVVAYAAPGGETTAFLAGGPRWGLTRADVAA